MDADRDTLLTTVYCMADDLLPCKAANAKRTLTDAELVTLCVAQAYMRIPEDPRFLATAKKQLREYFPKLPKQPCYNTRCNRPPGTIERLVSAIAAESPGAYDDLVLIDSTPVECGRSIETTRRSELAPWCAYCYCTSHSRHFWGMRLHAVFAPDGTPRAWALAPANAPERELAAELLASTLRGGEAVVGDKGYAGREFEAEVARLEASMFRPTRRDEPGRGPHLAPIRQRIESIFRTCNDLFALERHGARTINGLRVRIASRMLALAVGVYVNGWLGRPSRSLVAFVA
ncbi:MAG: IS982 family transposase [Solirubrobacterales bacterium]